MRRLMGMVTFLLLLPVGAFFDGWGSTFLFLLVFRFIRMRTGGYHAKTPEGCLLGSTFTMIVSLELAKRLHPVSNLICLAAASILILRLAPANNAALHLNAEVTRYAIGSLKNSNRHAESITIANLISLLCVLQQVLPRSKCFVGLFDKR